MRSRLTHIVVAEVVDALVVLQVLAVEILAQPRRLDPRHVPIGLAIHLLEPARTQYVIDRICVTDVQRARGGAQCVSVDTASSRSLSTCSNRRAAYCGMCSGSVAGRLPVRPTRCGASLRSLEGRRLGRCDDVAIQDACKPMAGVATCDVASEAVATRNSLSALQRKLFILRYRTGPYAP